MFTGIVECVGKVAAVEERGDLVHVPHLADTLAAIADEGASLFYAGELAQTISSHIRDGDGAVTREDLATFEAIERRALVTDIGAWHIATNPPPAVGGAVLTAFEKDHALRRLQRSAIGSEAGLPGSNDSHIDSSSVHNKLPFLMNCPLEDPYDGAKITLDKNI